MAAGVSETAALVSRLNAVGSQRLRVFSREQKSDACVAGCYFHVSVGETTSTAL